jgi:VCBS repeat-containing protein
MDFKNSDITSAQTITDLSGAEAAVALEAAATLAVAMQSANILPLTADGQLVLPAGVGLDDIKVVGRDLVIQMPDGTQMIVPDGAVFVPQIVVDGVAVPPLNIAALLIGQEPQPAAGRPQSSGGNFADPVGDIGDPFALGDLLPPTALAFPEPEEREIIPQLVDEEPTTIIITPDQPAGSINATASVNEAALPARGSEPAGSNEASNAETTTGTIVFDSPDGLASITLNGVAITAVGQVFVTPLGRLTITSIAPGNIGYSYTLTDNTVAAASNDVFSVVVTDTDGDTASANLTINIVDDAPVARNDTDSVPAANYMGQTGNVITGVGTTSGNAGADTQGADGAALSGIRAGTDAGTFAGAGTTINGQYGTLTIAANGNYTYTRNVGTPGGVNDVFTYQLTDGDGDTSTATLTISIGDSPAAITFIPSVGEGTVVSEVGLPPRNNETPGSNPELPVETTTGTISFLSPDGVASVSLGGTVITPGALPQQVFSDATGTLVVTAYSYDPTTGVGSITYSYTLTDNTVNTDGTVVSFPVVVRDLDGDMSPPDTLDITIQDDAPTAEDDSAGLSEGGPSSVTFDVDTNDVPGADGTGSRAFTSLTGTYGTITLNADGTQTYTLSAAGQLAIDALAPGATLTDTFNYTLTDGDGDSDPATLLVTLTGTDDPVVITNLTPAADGGDVAVDEDDLATGSDATPESLTQAGDFTISAPDGLDDLTVGTVNVIVDGVYVGGSAITPLGNTLTFTGYNPATGVVSYTYTLNAAETHVDGAGENSLFENFTVTLTDLDGSTTDGTLSVNIIDDIAEAKADVDSVTEDDFSGQNESVSADGNVITGVGGSDVNLTDGVADVEGADGSAVTAVAFGNTAGTVGGSTVGAYGSLVLNADGSYNYVLNNFSPAVQGLDGDDTLTEVFTYTITDGDGDPSETTLTITINGSDDPITINGLNVQGPELIVDEDDLADGSSPDATALTQTGSFTVNGTDGIAEIKIEGGNVVVGQPFPTAFGVFTITSVSAPVDGNATSITIGYSYTLTDNTAHANAGGENFLTEVFDIEVTDTDGSTDSDTIEVRVIDDVPAAAADSDTVLGGSNDPATGNVITDADAGDLGDSDIGADVQGADGATVTAITGVAAGTVGGTTNGTYGVLTLNADGSYSYTRNSGSPGNVEDVFTYEITDSDGDKATAKLTIVIEDARPVVGPNATVLLDDDALAGGIAGGTGDDADEANLSGTLSGSGGDGALTFALQTTENLDGFTYVTGPGGSILVNQGMTTVLTITLDSATGAYSVTQNAPIVHATGDNENNQSFTINYTVTDVDLDSAAGTLTIDVDDDTPTVTLTGAVPTLTVDETVLATNAGPTSFAGAFTVAYGADGAGTTAYTLTVNTAIASGLVDTATGAAVVLSVAGNVVTGTAGPAGPVVFTLTVDPANGNVTLDQQRAVSHGVDGGPGTAHDDPASLVAGAISLTATATDRDGDSAAQTIAIGDRLVFEDDGPTLAAATPTAGDLTVDETLLGTDDTASFAGLFTPTYGADGAGSVGNYVLGVSAAGAASGVVDVATGNQVFLFLEAGVVVGREGANAGAAATGMVVFTVSINASGLATLDQQRAVVHNDPLDADEPDASAVTLAASLITLTATVTDGDGDTNTATTNIGGAIRFEDDGPAIDAALGSDANVLLTTQDAETIGALTDSDVSTGNFSGVFTIASSSYGNDGAGTTVWNYGLSILNAASGLSSNGVPITLSPNAGVVEGRAGGAMVFSISVNATTGVVTLTQFAEIDHALENPTTAPFDDQFAVLANGLVQLTGTATITDKDGDSASETLNLDLGGNIRFADHGPTISSTGTAPTLTVDETNFGINAPASFAANFVTDFGADGAGTTAYALAATAGPSGLIDTLTGQAVNLVLNGSVVEGRTAGSNALVFTVTVSAGGTVTLDQSRAVIHSPDSGTNQPTTLSAADLVRLTATSTDGDGDTASATINIGQNLVFLDDAPTANVVALTGTVDEDGLTNGIAGGTGDVAGIATTATGSVATLFNAGADSPLTYQLTGSTAGLPAFDLGRRCDHICLGGQCADGKRWRQPRVYADAQ